MSENIEDWTNEVHQGDVIEKLQEMPAESVDLVITSPPYYALRDYGEEGQIGLEETPQEFIENITNVSNEISRVLKPTGSFYLNMGDTYAGSGTGQTTHKESSSSPVDTSNVDIQAKCKMMIPHRISISLIDEGWICRNDIVWSKPNPMPESVTDRRSTTFEYIFHFVKQKDYYYNLDSIRKPHKEISKSRVEQGPTNINQNRDGQHSLKTENIIHENGKNPGDIQDVTTANHSEAHFAVFPKELIKPHIKSSCPEDGVVLDPFIGSGTTAIAAEELDRDWIGIDLNKDYVDMSYDRIEDETTKIFDDRSFMDY